MDLISEKNTSSLHPHTPQPYQFLQVGQCLCSRPFLLFKEKHREIPQISRQCRDHDFENHTHGFDTPFSCKKMKSLPKSPPRNPELVYRPAAENGFGELVPGLDHLFCFSKKFTVKCPFLFKSRLV